MKAITSWEELKGKTIVGVIYEEVLIFSDNTFAYLESDFETSIVGLGEADALSDATQVELGVITPEEHQRRIADRKTR